MQDIPDIPDMVGASDASCTVTASTAACAGDCPQEGAAQLQPVFAKGLRVWFLAFGFWGLGFLGFRVFGFLGFRV